ncbi:MAG: S8 family serine peptidase [Pseudomonadota bacterium]
MTKPEVSNPSLDPRLDPMLAHMWMRGVADPTLIRKTVDGAEEISFLVRGKVQRADLAALGVKVGTQAGPVTTAQAPLSAIPALLNVPGVEAINAANELRPLLDVSASEIGAPAVWGGTQPPYTGLTGNGVVVGIVDTGIDLANPDFRTVDGRTRVKFLWDQSVFGTGPPGLSLCCGKEFTEDQINAGTATEIDADGHGTHMAGIAAGNGRATGHSVPQYTYVGIAPEADLIIVKGAGLSENDAINGVNYIFQRAAGLGKDAVVLVAWGDDNGAHDGGSNFDTALSALTGPGKIIVAAAGNNGGKAMHAQVNLASGQSATITFTIPAYTPNAYTSEYLSIEAWHSPGAMFNAKLTTPNGFTTGWIAPGTPHNVLYTTDGSFYVDNDLATNSKGAKQILFVTWDRGDGVKPSAGTWTLDVQRLTGSTNEPLDAWITGWKFGSPYNGVAPVFTSQINYTDLVMSPATGDSVISAGAYTTKTWWQIVEGCYTYYPDYYPNGLPGYPPYPTPPPDIAAFSSPGPRRDGVQRPDVAAPGQGVSASLSANATISGTDKMPDGVHWIYRGTSAAAAHVTGAVALMLQQTPHLCPDEGSGCIGGVRQRLIQNALADSFTGSVPNHAWGYGKLRLTPSAPDTQAPTAPGNLTATAASTSQINLSWSASTDNVAVTGYNVYRSGALIGSTTSALTYSDTGLAANTSYSYTVKAKDAAGNLSAASNTASATTLAVPDTQAPTAPTNLTATAASTSQINLSWSASTDNVAVTGYNVYRGGSLIGSTTSALTYSDTGLSANTSYSYTVKAKDAAGNLSAASNVASATTQALPPGPNFPPNVSLMAVKGSSGVVTFSASASDSDGTVISCFIDFGDGSPRAACGTSVKHTYAPGTFQAIATATDDDGATSSSSPFSIQVNRRLKIRISVLTGTSTHGLSDPMGIRIDALSDGQFDSTASLSIDNGPAQTNSVEMQLNPLDELLISATSLNETLRVDLRLENDGSFTYLGDTDPSTVEIVGVADSALASSNSVSVTGDSVFGCGIVGAGDATLLLLGLAGLIALRRHQKAHH